MSSVIPDPATNDWVPMWNLGSNVPAVQPSVRVWRSTAQSIANAAWVPISFDTVTYDTLSPGHWTTANPTRVYCQVAGTYAISGMVQLAGAAGGQHRLAVLSLNGAGGYAPLAEEGQVQNANFGPSGNMRANVTTIWKLNVGDYIELLAYQDSGAALNAVAIQSGQALQMAMVGGMQGPPGIAANVSYGTQLPSNPIDGQEAILVDSLTNPAYQWRFRYNAGSSVAYKWEFVGGAFYHRTSITGDTQTNLSTWEALPNSPFFTVPRTGIYDFQVNEGITAGANAGMAYTGLCVGTGATLAVSLGTNVNIEPGVPLAVSGEAANSFTDRILCNAGDVIRMAHWSTVAGLARGSGSGSSFGRGRELRVLPVKVS